MAQALTGEASGAESYFKRTSMRTSFLLMVESDLYIQNETKSHYLAMCVYCRIGIEPVLYVLYIFSFIVLWHRAHAHVTHGMLTCGEVKGPVRGRRPRGASPGWFHALGFLVE